MTSSVFPIQNLSSSRWSVRSCVVCPLQPLPSKATLPTLTFIHHPLNTQTSPYVSNTPNPFFPRGFTCTIISVRNSFLDLPRDQFLTQVSLPHRGTDLLPQTSLKLTPLIIYCHGISEVSHHHQT